MLNKQSIRGKVLIFMNNMLINDKEVIINERFVGGRWFNICSL